MTTREVQDVIAKELALLTPDVRRDPSRVGALLDPGYREIGASGRLWSREDIISALAGESASDATIIDASEVGGELVTADLVLVTYVTEHAGRRARRSSLWRRRGGVWLLLFHQGTLSDL